ncbi:Fumonisin B1 esterase [Pseudocercospora fuligena]|uniref:Fumonisin B1 esterase n=1 Tax=Pseudocercospora fuligena TaxID=685502 RepID=A0A8H6R713_9PEZI|nr:Fumonisin B1 esterase [Pseudocercospora fuligena]
MFSPVTSLAVLSAYILAPAQAQLWNKTIQTSYGPVQGFQYFSRDTLEKYFNTSSANVTAFLGVPYGADTAYENRWKPAQPPTKWNTTLKATAFGPACPNGISPYSSDTDVSEDCLTMNIWTNAGSADAKLPVMLWNQGSAETSNNPWWYGGGMALKDVILVSFNRRDDAFGYLAHPDLNQEGFERTGHYTSGNYGVLDQLAVLKWIKENIANFGGDPDRVTVAGQSFGSSQVYHAVNSELFTGYFHGGISESGIRYPKDTLLAGLATSYVTMEDALLFGQNYTETHNVTSIAELRKLSMDELLIGSGDRVGNNSIWWITALEAQYPLIFKPVLDGYVLPKKYIETLADGPANDVPVITGNTLDESGAATTTNYTISEWKYYNELRFGSQYENLTKLYPIDNNDTTANTQWNQIQTDISLVGSWLYATEWYKAAKSNFYTYFWTHAPPGQTQGAFHQSEIMYALNALYANADTYPFTAQDYEIQAKMSAYWANFAKTLDPNSGGSYVGNGTLTTWKPNDANGTQVVMQLGNKFGEQPVAEPARVEFVQSWFERQAAF